MSEVYKVNFCMIIWGSGEMAPTKNFNLKTIFRLFTILLQMKQ